MRTSGADLPTKNDLFDILALESQRKAVKFDFIDKNHNLFLAYKRLASLAGAETKWIDDYRTIELGELVKRATRTTDELCNYIAHKTPDVDDVFDALVRRDESQEADAIFVFGSPSDVRVHVAIDLYKRGFADKVILSGRGPHYGVNEVSEAERMRRVAIAAGIPSEAIRTENEAVTIPDNVKRTLDMFEQEQWFPRKLLIVVASFVTTRAAMDWYKFSPWLIEVMCVSPPDGVLSEAFRRDGWYKSEQGTRVVLNEYYKIIVEHKMDLLREAG